jgi:hypothetical protein
MTTNKQSRFGDNMQTCGDWSAINDAFTQQFPMPKLRRDSEDGEVYPQGWVFRGHKCDSQRLEPLIEREYTYSNWPEVEHRSLLEFQSKARMHMNPAHLPQTEEARDKLSWLAIMQHYGAPTRLLDFTYSPYVALYFALRNRRADDQANAEVWAINAAALQAKAEKTSRAADEEIRQREDRPSEVHPVNFGDLSFYSSALQRACEEDGFWKASIRNALSPCGVRREHFNRAGFVSMALPPVQNVRLSAQQGVFLFSGAEDLKFEESLHRMMKGLDRGWYRRLRVPASALCEVEKRLFQVNIHELSLFPDVEGLAGFVRQKIRLHW